MAHQKSEDFRFGPFQETFTLILHYIISKYLFHLYNYKYYLETFIYFKHIVRNITQASFTNINKQT